MTSLMLCQLCAFLRKRQALNAKNKMTKRCDLRPHEKCTTWRKYSCSILAKYFPEYLAELQDKLGVSRHSVMHVAYKKRGVATVYLE